MHHQESRGPATTARKRRAAGVAIGLIAIAALFYWSTRSDKPTAPPAPGGATRSEEKSEIAKKDHRPAAARGLAHIDLGKLKNRQERIQRIRQDIESADDPDVVFKEVADMIASEGRPIERSVLVGDIFNEMFRFDSAAQGLEWMRRYQGYLVDNFKDLASGHDGTLSTENGYTVLKNAAGSFLMKMRMAGQGDDLLDLCLKLPEAEILNNRLMLDIFSMCAMQNGTSKISGCEVPDHLKQAMFESALSQVNPLENFRLGKYLSEDYARF
ncbi:hypothetical protein OJ996_08600 [Luteolibacter sp. GHJ8]|uniref:Uncharacterized protein n=1 Tax=Luteolibacter rhizosphaerae TaxID=2989719 RepID=A0ABT3G1C4_9BACT|nr:hypothetical protein [Luteolibacter rhizosphaerae]MCW1913632.1 hypothetical protein [Luteolibacter rhizosphaerae]